MSDAVERAAALVTEISALLLASTLPDKTRVLVTSDHRDIDKHRFINSGVIVVSPFPALSWPAPKITIVTWKVDIVAGGVDNPLAAWERLDAIIDVLRPVYLIPDATAAPGGINRTDGVVLPGYIIQFPETLQQN